MFSLDKKTFTELRFATNKPNARNIFQTMDVKGQMIHLPESDRMLFLGSPSVEKLDELIAKGLYISDLPIHDATRDVILVGEQTKAQVKSWSVESIDISIKYENRILHEHCLGTFRILNGLHYLLWTNKKRKSEKKGKTKTHTHEILK